MGTYCTVEDIADFLRVDITDTSVPNKKQVEKLIGRKEDEIDRRTGHAWRERTAKQEVHDLNLIYEFGWGSPIFLRHRSIRTTAEGGLDPSQGDKLEIFKGGSSGINNGGVEYEDVTQSPTGTFELEPIYGRVYMRGFIFTVMRKNRIRVTYRYGETEVPEDITDICTKMVAMELMTTSLRADILPIGGSGGWSWKDSFEQWKEDIDRVISQRQELITIA